MSQVYRAMHAKLFLGNFVLHLLPGNLMVTTSLREVTVPCREIVWQIMLVKVNFSLMGKNNSAVLSDGYFLETIIVRMTICLLLVVN